MKESKFETARLDENNQSTESSRERVNEEGEGEVLLTRSQRHKVTPASDEGDKPSKAKLTAEKPTSDNKTPWWATTAFWIVRKCIAPVIMIIMLVIGLYIGYTVVGGQSDLDVFKFETWKHMWDLIFADV